MDFKPIVKRFIPEHFLFLFSTAKLYIRNSNYISAKEYRNWIRQGKPLPPPHIVKQKTIEEYKNRFNLSTLIETGTYLGDMVYAQKDNFKRIISVELQSSFYKDAVKRFKKYNHIKIVQGDSGEVLKKLAENNEFNTPCLFWLDGHYSAGDTAMGVKETPIIEEMNTIMNTCQNHIVLVDDARCFTGSNDYPTVSGLEALVKKRNPEAVISEADDIIRIELKFS